MNLYYNLANILIVYLVIKVAIMFSFKKTFDFIFMFKIVQSENITLNSRDIKVRLLIYFKGFFVKNNTGSNENSIFFLWIFRMICYLSFKAI